MASGWQHAVCSGLCSSSNSSPPPPPSAALPPPAERCDPRGRGGGGQSDVMEGLVLNLLEFIFQKVNSSKSVSGTVSNRSLSSPSHLTAVDLVVLTSAVENRPRSCLVIGQVCGWPAFPPAVGSTRGRGRWRASSWGWTGHPDARGTGICLFCLPEHPFCPFLLPAPRLASREVPAYCCSM